MAVYSPPRAPRPGIRSGMGVRPKKSNLSGWLEVTSTSRRSALSAKAARRLSGRRVKGGPRKGSRALSTPMRRDPPPAWITRVNMPAPRLVPVQPPLTIDLIKRDYNGFSSKEMNVMKTIADVLDEMTVDNMELAQALGDNAVRCYACAHRCLIRDGRRGICQVRFNKDGKLMVPWGYVAGMQADPIEKKPFFHLLPGEDALTFGMLGCDLHCGYCQNWLSSQVLRDPVADQSIGLVRRISPAQMELTDN